jgi:hypothetical protein
MDGNWLFGLRVVLYCIAVKQLLARSSDILNIFENIWGEYYTVARTVFKGGRQYNILKCFIMFYFLHVRLSARPNT